MNKKQLSLDSTDHEEDVKIGSDRSFGFVFAIFFLIVASVQFWTGHHSFWPWLFASGAFLLITLIVPRLLHPLNFVWFKFGILLHLIISPVILGLMFFVVFTPMSIVMRLLKKRPLNLQFDAQAKSYWIQRKPPGPLPETFKNQF